MISDYIDEPVKRTMDKSIHTVDMDEKLFAIAYEAYSILQNKTVDRVLEIIDEVFESFESKYEYDEFILRTRALADARTAVKALKGGEQE